MAKTQVSYVSSKWILFSFILFNIISYLYVVFTGSYNGDFLGIESKLSSFALFINLLLTVIPFVVLYVIYKYYIRINKRHKITIPVKPFAWFLLILILFQIVVTKLFDVGILGQEVYKAPIRIQTFIQIFNRFDVVFGVSLYTLVVDRNNKFKYLLWFLVVVLSILRASLSIFVIIVFLFILLKYDSIWNFIRKRWLLFVALLIVSPIAINILYDVRHQLRHSNKKVEINIKSDEENTFSLLVFGKLTGRLSSFSNSAIIQERKNTIKNLTQDFSTFQYPKEALAAVYGRILNPNDVAYKNLLYESEGNHSRTYSSMNGTQGLLLISSYQSYSVFFINLFTILMLVILSFELVSLLRYERLYEVVFLFFCFTVMSGNAVEYMNRLMVTALYVFLFLFINLFRLSTTK